MTAGYQEQEMEARACGAKRAQSSTLAALLASTPRLTPLCGCSVCKSREEKLLRDLRPESTKWAMKEQ